MIIFAIVSDCRRKFRNFPRSASIFRLCVYHWPLQTSFSLIVKVSNKRKISNSCEFLFLCVQGLLPKFTSLEDGWALIIRGPITCLEHLSTNLHMWKLPQRFISSLSVSRCTVLWNLLICYQCLWQLQSEELLVNEILMVSDSYSIEHKRLKDIKYHFNKN